MTESHVEQVDCGRWRALAPTFSDYNYRQVWGFGRACAGRLGAISEHVAVRRGAELVALADVRVKRTPVLHTGIAYVNGGPLVRRGLEEDGGELTLALEALRDRYVGERGMVLRIAPSPGPPAWNETLRRVYGDSGFRPAAAGTHYRTILIDLARPPAELRAGLHQKWRNQLNQAERHNLTLQTGRDGGTFAAFCRLYGQMIERKRFAAELDAAFYARVQEDLAECEKFEVTLAQTAEGEVVAGHVAALHGDTAVYLLGATTQEGLNTRASYLLQWNVLISARNSGYLWYDLGGVDPRGNAGVYTFKSRMGGTEVAAAGPYEAAPDELSRLVVRSGERVYRLMRTDLGIGK